MKINIMNRVWVYTSDKELTGEMRQEISRAIEVFLSGWNAHGQQLSASYEILHDRFIVIKANEAEFAASGCSIDKQVQFIKKLGDQMKIDFFNRLLVAIKKDDGVEVIHSSKIPDLLKSGQLKENALIYNASVADEKSLKEEFLIQLKDSWLRKFIPGEKI
jgi:hypothetical protein